MEVRYSKGDYFIKEKIDGQTYLMIFSNWDGTDKTEYFNISLQVISKRKHADAEMDNVVTTGKNPYTTINFAIKAFKILEEHVLKKYPSKNRWILYLQPKYFIYFRIYLSLFFMVSFILFFCKLLIRPSQYKKLK